MARIGRYHHPASRLRHYVLQDFCANMLSEALYFFGVGITSAFPVPEQLSKPEGGEGEAGEGAILLWPRGEEPTQGHGVRRGGCWGGRRAPFGNPSAEQQLAIASLLIPSVQQAQQQLGLCVCKAGTDGLGSRAWASVLNGGPD